MMARMTSISVPPIWNPTLPPSIRMPAGADQPASVRHETNPRPNLAPTTKAPFFRPGTIATHCAFLSRSAGIARSPIFVTSSNTATLFSSRATVCACASNDAARTTSTPCNDGQPARAGQRASR